MSNTTGPQMNAGLNVDTPLSNEVNPSEVSAIESRSLIEKRRRWWICGVLALSAAAACIAFPSDEVGHYLATLAVGTLVGGAIGVVARHLVVGFILGFCFAVLGYVLSWVLALGLP